MSSKSPTKKSKLDRRQFIRTAGALAGGAGMLSATTGAAENAQSINRIAPDADYDAIVIGGGFAGITAARELRADGLNTLILEARNRLGGRTYYSEFAGHKVELGGTWIHWSQPFVWAEKERYDLDLVETPGAATPDHVYMTVKGEAREIGSEEFISVVEAFNAYVADGRAILERPFDVRHQWQEAIEADKLSAKDRLEQLDLTEVQRVGMDGILAGMAHNTSDTMSYLETLRWFGLPGYGFTPFMDAVSRYKFKDGTASLIDKMIEDGNPDVRLSTPVREVKDIGDSVRVTTEEGGSVTGGVAVIALPMNVLPDVTFEPGLDPKLIAAAGETHTGRGFKCFIKVKGRAGNFMSLADSTAPLNAVFTYAEAQDHTLLVAFGSSSDVIDPDDDEALQAELRKTNPEIEVDSSYRYDWVLDPYSKGTYCSYRPGWLTKYFDHFQKDSGRMVFAQGDHGEGWRGFIDGAIGAGIRAAERIRQNWS